ncbi:PREDICTED: CASP-like protein PIMP1 isoform X2 [Ipomoea nil]|uniref:CASP-like protein PIMP1 isoform X2 n=1 Tax=Ipomoea nil TaxID=35883 RepID=UPI0009016B8E|nr:PREDICTED: CASP-like protein PIMP1 isoform X2 [Ipomoea nil]
MGNWEKVNLALRILSFASLVVSIIFSLTSTSGNNCDNNNNNYFPFDFDVKIKLNFKDFYAYRYTLSVNAIGTVYSFIQFVLAIVGMKSDDDKSSDALVKANPYLDQVMAILLGTGAAAGFGLTLDLKHLRCGSTITRSFLNKMTVASVFCAGGFGFTAASSFVSLKIYEEEMDVCC